MRFIVSSITLVLSLCLSSVYSFVARTHACQPMSKTTHFNLHHSIIGTKWNKTSDKEVDALSTLTNDSTDQFEDGKFNLLPVTVVISSLFCNTVAAMAVEGVFSDVGVSSSGAESAGKWIFVAYVGVSMLAGVKEAIVRVQKYLDESGNELTEE